MFEESIKKMCLYETENTYINFLLLSVKTGSNFFLIGIG